MFHTFEEGKDLIIEKIVHQLQQKTNVPDAFLCAEFARQFFSTMSLDDLQDCSVDDLCGVAVNFWSLIQQRKPGEIKIRIYNPELQRDGWQTTHTVIQVLCDDMSFLVDSLRMVINRMGLGLHLVIHMGGVRLTRDAHHNVTAI